MDVTFNIGGKSVTIAGEPDQIAGALDNACRSNKEFYNLAKGVVGTIVAEKVAEEARKQAIFAGKSPQRAKILQRDLRRQKREKNEK